ncbi:ABC transporter permease [Haloimpatiens sp. FM7315]|uniref:ABC transporter permease n=1 Tax=Haloimpatiens sp. FM7315 TaxID=3298609 RepID=UPI00370C1191
MTSIKLAIKNILRIPGRSILIGIIMLVISIAVLVSLSIQSSTRATLENTRKKLGNDVTLKVNMQNIQKKAIQNMKNGSPTKVKIDPITTDKADRYAKSKYVTDYDYTKEIPLTTDKKVVGENTNNGNVNMRIGSVSGDNTEMPKLKLVSNLKPKYQSEFRSGNKAIVDGRFYTEEEVNKKEPVAVISKNLADLNNLKVGDTLIVKSVGDAKKSANLKIIGLYQDKIQQDNNMPIPYMYRDNEVYTTLTIARDLFGNDDQKPVINAATYFIDDPKNIQAFKEEVKSLGLNLENYVMDANDDTYTKMAGPLEKLNSVIKIFLIIVIITGSAIMMLLMTMITRERKFEVGILRALGLKRSKIAFQFITETLIVVSLALGIGVISGGTVSQKAADYLLQREITVQKESEKEKEANTFGNVIMMGQDSSTNKTNVEPIDKIDIKVENKEIFRLILIGLFISSAGSIVSSYWIMKYEPMKILSNRT